jgi:hypothetical protein
MTPQRLLRTLGAIVVLAMVIALVGSAFAAPAGPTNSLSVRGNLLLQARGSVPHAPPVVAAITVPDGSFEYGPPPDSLWTEVTNTACEWIGDWTDAWEGVGAYDGKYDFWAGGYCGGVPATSSVEQDIVVPTDDTTLTFWYISYRPDDDDPTPEDYAYVQVDTAAQVNGVEVWHLDFIQANDTYPNWVQAAIDLSAWAGQTIHIKFGAVSLGDLTGNIRFDFIGAPTYPPCPVTIALGAQSSSLGTLYQFRDKVMAGTPAGRKYINLYYRHGAEVTGILLRNADLRGRAALLIEKYLPAVKAMVGQPGGQEMVLTARDVRQVEAFLDGVAGQGSPALRTDLAGLRTQVAGFAGKTTTEVWQALAK